MKQEKPVPWGQVVESDEIYSTKTGKWYEVVRTVAAPGGQVKVWTAASPKPFLRPAAEQTTVRRGPTGAAVDVFQIIFSGPTGPGAR